MDTLTQFTLGAAIGTVSIGRHVGIRSAALTGGILATLPDFDVFLPFDGPIDAFVEHRGWTHSLFVHTLLAVPAGEVLFRLFRKSSETLTRTRMFATVWLAFTTHALLDWTTTYGTRLLWPVSDTPYALSSIFIIDPLYTLPLLFAVLGALIFGAHWRKAVTASVVALCMSTAYLGWTYVSQQIGEAKVRSALAAEGIEPEQLTMIPMPFNSFLWRGVVIDGDEYINIYRSVFDERADAPFHRHARNLIFDRKLDGYEPPQRVERFSKGNYAYRRDGEDILISDIRMGVTPDYVFTFRVGTAGRVAELDNETGTIQIDPADVERVRSERDLSGLDWLFTRIFDESAARNE